MNGCKPQDSERLKQDEHKLGNSTRPDPVSRFKKKKYVNTLLGMEIWAKALSSIPSTGKKEKDKTRKKKEKQRQRKEKMRKRKKEEEKEEWFGNREQKRQEEGE